jgi:two-component system chemotaxis response regulator CheY
MMFLLVEDSPRTRNLIKSYLNDIEIGHRGRPDFLEAESGEAALILLKKNRVDFILLDWHLTTSMTGLDVLKEIRKEENLKHIPIIMVTSESDKIKVIEALKFGANDFVVKPIDKKSFTEKVLKAALSNM